MKKINFKRFIVLVLVLAAAAWQTLLAAPTNREWLFDEDWLFFRGAALGADKADYQDDFWRKLDLPHDWSIEDLPNTQSPFDRGALSQVNGGFTTGGTGWYRKHFTMPKNATGNRYVVQFDGVYMNADFYLNGKKLGNHPYGYTSFYFDITDHLRFDTVNVIAVKVANEGVNSRWYSGSGIYRHVWLKTLPAVHLSQWGTFITTPQVSEVSAQVNLETKVTNSSKTAQRVKLVTHLQNANGFKAAKIEREATIAPGQTHVFAERTTLQNPQRWSIESPSLYTAVSQVFINGVQVDEDETAFGIRSISFDATNGFRLNGKTVKLKGGCVHNDNGALGAKAFDAAEERKVAVLKASGFNAIRTSHNPPSAEFLDACDRLGMLVIDEAFDCWEQKKNANDYHLYFKEWWQRDIESLLLRDRNHPSIIMWSTGNEIPNRDKPEVAAVSKKLTEFIKQFDTTRPVTCGVNGVDETKDLFFSTMDVAGYNYAPKQYVPDHKRKPDRVMYGSESFSRYAFEYWMAVEDNPYVIGDFVWTAYDYIGEASIGWLGYPQRQHFFPWNLAYCGDIDVCGWKRPQSYYRDVLWMPNQLSFFVKAPKPTFDTATYKKEVWAEWDYKDLQPHWTWPGNENKTMEVDVYSSCDEVELFLNNKSLGKKKTNRANRFTATYQVPYVKGELKVVGFTNKKIVQQLSMLTAGVPAKIIATVEKNSLAANGQDLSYINFEIVDEAGIRVPTAEHLLQFECSGSGSLIAVANANPTSIESYSLPQRKAWQGRAQAVVKAGKTKGNILLKVFGENLAPVEVELQVQ